MMIAQTTDLMALADDELAAEQTARDAAVVTAHDNERAGVTPNLPGPIPVHPLSDGMRLVQASEAAERAQAEASNEVQRRRQENRAAHRC